MHPWPTGSEGEQDPMSSYRVSIGCFWSVMVDCHEGEVFIVWGMLVLRYIFLLLYTVGEIVNIVMVVYSFLFFSSAVVYFGVEECSTISGSVT